MKLLEEGFKRLVYWNEYQTKILIKISDKNNLARCPLDASFQGVKRLFVLAFDNSGNNDKKFERGSYTKYFFKSKYN